METKTETNMEICMYKDFMMEMCTMHLIFSFFVVLLTVIYPRNTLLCRTLSALYIVINTKRVEFFSLWTFSQSWYMLLRQNTYQHDPQGILINVISIITCHVVVT